MALLESDLYAPVKAHLEAAGYTVRAEVRQCDVVGVREDVLVGVELKLVFGLGVLYQALERLGSVDLVYVAVSVPEGVKARANWDAQVPNAVRLCRRLGVGLMHVRDGLVSVLADPGPYQPRQMPKQRARMLGEFTRRSGDHNVGGTTKRPRVTAYREAALMCVRALAAGGNMSPRALRRASGVETTSAILQRDVYSWFRKVERGVYSLSPAGEAAMELYADVITAQMQRAARIARENGVELEEEDATPAQPREPHDDGVLGNPDDDNAPDDGDEDTQALPGPGMR